MKKIPDTPYEKDPQKKVLEKNFSITPENFNKIDEKLSNIYSLADNKKIIKSILFACEKCNGPLVPNSICIVCKKTSIRNCQNCGIKEESGNHVYCGYLIFASRIKRT